jgi:hypothetical protein
MVWKRASNGTVKLKWKCGFGPRRDRVVSDVKQCSAAPNLKKSQAMKKTRARTKVKQARKAKKTKKVNPATRLATRLNKLSRRR